MMERRNIQREKVEWLSHVLGTIILWLYTRIEEMER